MGKIIDITGQQFGDWKVLDISIKRKNGTFWNCACKCGTKAVVSGANLRRGQSKRCHDCSCIAYEDPFTAPGNIIGNWQIVEKDIKKPGYSICRCKCGITSSINRASLRKGQSTRCRKCAGRLLKKDHKEMIGRKFYKWTVMGYQRCYSSTRSNRVVYKCQCACGKIKLIPRYILVSLKTSQCLTCSLKNR